MFFLQNTCIYKKKAVFLQAKLFGMSYIHAFYIDKLWGHKDVRWNNINPDVNIIVGINGSGKTTLLNLMHGYYASSIRSISSQINGKYISTTLRAIPENLENDMPILYLRSLDNVPLRDKRKSESQLLQELNAVVYQNADGSPSFFGYRMRMLDYAEEAERIQSRINRYLEIVNNLFSDSYKKIEIQDSKLVVAQKNGIISLDKLSSGEKQILLLTMRVFLTNEQPSVIFMDEPEISMHISWQNQLIDVLRELNPNAQLFITTHSPSVLSKGWGERITYMEDITI